MNRIIEYSIFCFLFVFPSVTQATLNIVTTTPDLAAIAAEVGKERVSLTALAGFNQDPHFVDARPNYIVILNKADLLIVNGLELEVGWLPQIQSQARNSDINIGAAGYLDASAYVSLEDIPTTKIDRSQGDVHPGGNPHFTLSPLAAIGITEGICERLIALDPDHSEEYLKNSAVFIAELEQFAQEQQSRFASLDDSERRFVSYHKSLIYLTQWLDLKEIITIEPVPGISPDPGHVAKVVKTMRSTGTRIIIQEEFYPTNTSKRIEQLVDGHLVVIEGFTRFNKQSYIEHLYNIVDPLYKAMEK